MEPGDGEAINGVAHDILSRTTIPKINVAQSFNGSRRMSDALYRYFISVPTLTAERVEF